MQEENSKPTRQEYLKKYRKEYYQKNKDKLLNQTKEWQEANKEKIKESKKKYYEENKERIKKVRKNYTENNPEKLKEYNKKYTKRKRQEDITYKLKGNLRNRLYHALKAQVASKSFSTLTYIGCSLEEYKKYIESLWLPGMSWENWTTDGWHIDHIVPLTSFNLLDEEELQKAFHYTNTQPLWAEDNLRKGNRKK
jgi:hypothetical protein